MTFMTLKTTQSTSQQMCSLKTNPTSASPPEENMCIYNNLGAKQVDSTVPAECSNQHCHVAESTMIKEHEHCNIHHNEDKVQKTYNSTCSETKHEKASHLSVHVDSNLVNPSSENTQKTKSAIWPFYILFYIKQSFILPDFNFMCKSSDENEPISALQRPHGKSCVALLWREKVR